MKSVIFILIPLLLLLTACAQPQVRHSPFPKSASPVQTGLEVTLLPTLDSRDYPSDNEFPDLAKGATITVPARDVAAPAKKSFLRQGLFSNIKNYIGPLPDYSDFKWSSFPLRGLETDLALGLEIKRLEIMKTGNSPYQGARALLNAAALPFSALGILISNGHFDLGGWLTPAGEIKYNLAVELNILSKKGGGLIFSKTFQAHEIDPKVSDKELFEGLSRSKKDGQSLGRAALPRLAESVFSQICRDPEMAFLNQYVNTAWLGRVMRDMRVRPEVKTRLLTALISMLVLPSLTEAEVKALAYGAGSLPDKVEMTSKAGRDGQAAPVRVLEKYKARSLQGYDVDKAWLEKEAVRGKLLDQTCRILLSLTGELNSKKMRSALSENENILMRQTMAILGRLGQNYTANQLYRFRLQSSEVDLNEKKSIVLLLSQSLETLDNEDFIIQEIKVWENNLKTGTSKERLESAALLVTLKGPEAVKEWTIDQSLLLKVLSSDDTWAESRVLSELDQGNLSPEVLRLAGALKPVKALPVLMAAFKKSLETYKLPPQGFSSEKPEKIPLHPVSRKRNNEKSGPDPVLIVRALGNFKKDTQVKTQLRSFLNLVLAEKEFRSDQTALTAEVIRSLGRLGDQESKEAIFELWSRRWPQAFEAHLIRRSALEAMTGLGENGMWGRILKTARNNTADLNENQAMLREVADFFGQVRYIDAVPLLVDIINHPNLSDLMLKACFHALSRIASPEAKERLQDLTLEPNWHLSRIAASALEDLVLEQALWENLKVIK
ncbi:MAG: HEAT repeat domain-containing protein [Deltaproteobacteria bacterium]|nr:HEAT repeat domain-containing protein [Deltaproteobacteria bacterium]MBW2140294.1 HEAT repeat domain-containing protein [Deltaproteobacteria bacterium]